MASTGGQFEIVGLKAFQGDLKRLSAELPKAMRAINVRAANSIRDAAVAMAQGWGGVQAKASQSLRAVQSGAAASIRGGGGAPYFYGAEFGSKQFHQFKPWRGNQWSGWGGGPGYFLHPTIRTKGPEVLEQYIADIEKLCARTFH